MSRLMPATDFLPRFLVLPFSSASSCSSSSSSSSSSLRPPANWEGAFRVPCMIRWPGHIAAGQVSNEIVSGHDWLPTLMAAAGDPDVKDKLLKGYKVAGKTFKVHIDGYNQLHMSTMTFARRLAHVENIPQQDSAERAFNKLARTFAAQVEALKRYRSGGEQTVRVEHVTVNEGGRAIVGNVSHGGRGSPEKMETSS